MFFLCKIGKNIKGSIDLKQGRSIKIYSKEGIG